MRPIVRPEQTMKTAIIAPIALAGILCVTCMASEEGVLPIRHFTLQSQGIGNSGPVTVEGRKDDKGQWEKMSISAFGKTFSVDTETLGKLDAAFMNGSLLSYEEGYAEAGGRTVYVTLLQGFTSGIQVKQTLRVSEDGSISLIDTSKREGLTILEPGR